MTKFRSTRNPELRIVRPTRGIKIQFEGGYYETDDRHEIHVLRKNSTVEEVPASFQSGGVIPSPRETIAGDQGPEIIRGPALGEGNVSDEGS